MNILSYEIITEQTHDGKWWYTVKYKTESYLTSSVDNITLYCYQKHSSELDAYNAAVKQIEAMKKMGPCDYSARPELIDDFIEKEAMKTRGLLPERRKTTD